MSLDSFKEGSFVHEASSSTGVAGFFVFRNKQELVDIPTDGALVPWLNQKKLRFDTFYLDHVYEIGTVAAFEQINVPAICRPFNEVQINAETVTKRGIDEQGKKIAEDEIAWYKHVQGLGFSYIPRIYSYEPLIMERVRGKNVWEYEYLTYSEKKAILDSIIRGLLVLHELEPGVRSNKSDLDENYINKTFARLKKVEGLIPFARDEFIKINGRYYRNVLFDENAFNEALNSVYPSEFKLIHGDCTFSNILYDRLNQKVVFIDPRGYFGKTKLYGDVDYDWAKLYYSIIGNYDQFNRKHFSLRINEKAVELAIKSNNWEDTKDYFFESIGNVSRDKIKALHAIIWLSLTTYAWEDYDSICAAFYNGIVQAADFL